MTGVDRFRDRFELGAVTGKGGMGTVYRARDRESGREVAVKVMHHDVDHEERARFLREAETICDLHHPAIVRYVAHGTTQGAPYLVMEWLEGEDLSARLARGVLSPADAVALALRIAGALSLVHQRGLVHRDIKPANVFLEGGNVGRAKLLDFGVARMNQADPLTRPGISIGTPGYMAPEQVRGEREIDGRADLYGLGCVLFHCLTGRPPVQGDNAMMLYAKVLLQDPPRLRAICPDLPSELDSFVAKLLAKEPANRPANADQVVEALSRIAPACSVAVPETAPVITSGETRLLTILLVGSSARLPESADRAEALDHTRAGSNAAWRRLWAIVESHGGRLDTIATGVRVITRRGAGRPGDDAAAIARCALALRAVMPDAPMAIAIGRTEGSVAGAEGSVIERGAALLDQASATGANAIRVDDAIGSLLAARFELRRDAGGLVLAGLREDLEPARRLLGRSTPCLGREREIGSVVALLHECVEEAAPRVAIVTGPPGIGKTRVLQELLERVQRLDEPPEIWITHGDEINAGSAYGMVARALQRASGLRGGESLEAQQRVLGDWIASAIAGPDLEHVRFFLGEVCGVPFPTGDDHALRGVRDDPTKLAPRAQWAFEKLLAAHCARRPLVLVLEDLHWGDLPTVRMVDAALHVLAGAPLFVLALARPEVHDVFPRLWGSRSPQVTSLGELGRKVSERIVKDLLGDRADAALTAGIVERAAGNAFFIEELVRAVAEGRADETPDSVLAVVQARLEAIVPEARRVLRAASIFGQSFTRAGVEALVGGADSLDPWLDDLVRREVIVPVRQTSGGVELYRFCHALVHQAAHAMLTDADRRLGHRLAGEWLERSGARDAILLASHFERAGDTGRAAAFYTQAAEAAYRGGDIKCAARHAAQGIATGVDADTLGRARWIAAETSRQLGDQRAAVEHAAEAMRLLPPGTPRWYQAQRTAVFVGMTAFYGKMG